MADHLEDIRKKAINMLEQCESVQLASINDSGYPRICEMEKVKAIGFSEIYFTTLVKSEKIKHFSENNKAGVSYCIDNDSVSLVGEIEIIEDLSVKKSIWQGAHVHRFIENEDSSPKYCILKFKAHKAVFFIDGEKTIVNITDSGKV